MENVRKPIKRIAVYLSRLAGPYPELTFRVNGHEVPFRRGRLRLEGEDVDASEVEVEAAEGSEFVPRHSPVPVKDGKIFVELVPDVKEMTPAEVVYAEKEDEPDTFEEVPAAEYFDDDEAEPEGRASRATVWILGLACLVCIGVIAWFLLGNRGKGAAVVSDSDSAKADTVQTDSPRVDTTAQHEASTAEQTYLPTGGNYYTPENTETEPEEEAPKKRSVPEGTDLATEMEH